jgi:predicted amidohydrolase
VEPGKWYRFTAYYRAEGVAYESQKIVSRLDWEDKDGNRAGQPDYAYRVLPEGDWKRVTLDAPAPPAATGVKLQFYLANCPQGTVYWDDIAFDEIPDPGSRQVTIATINLYPRGTASPEKSVKLFIENIEQSIKQRTDLIVLPEAINVVGTGKGDADVAEPIPGPTTAQLGEVAKRRKTYIVAGVYEREGHTVYNAAVLLDREGTLIGKYRKVYLPREEIEAGMTPGNDYPVFQTDFGRVGMMICWDVQYADPARALAMRGAEIILLPIWGGSVLIEKARAYENHVFLVTSAYDTHTQIIDPNGEVVVESPKLGTPAIATIDLNRRYVDEWLGDMRERFMKEVRLDVKPD